MAATNTNRLVLSMWMLNNAWPGLIWHLYDYDLLAPAGGYFGSKKALELVHVLNMFL